jgi:hypothetical protein
MAACSITDEELLVDPSQKTESIMTALESFASGAGHDTGFVNKTNWLFVLLSFELRLSASVPGH